MNDFFGYILRFIRQSDAGKLGALGFPKSYHNLNTKFGFGQGNSARVTWISFTAFGQSVQQGIYPVFLYYKSAGILILAYGVSATRPPNRKWTFIENSALSVDEYFRQNRLGIPPKYGESYVYRSYTLTSRDGDFGLNEEIMIGDLDALIEHYIKVFSGSYQAPVVHEPDPTPPRETKENKPVPLPVKFGFDVSAFINDARLANFMISTQLATRYVASLLTKPFVILTGLSGSGKTKLAQLFAEWICDSQDQFRLVPVGADWTNREPLLGYPNALDESKYVSPDNRVLELIVDAYLDPDRPYFLILDEMNMSHVERYFADFLSAMESGRSIYLHSGKSNIKDVPDAFILPTNLFIVGTVNVDETTYMFSPKVLDRACVIEFRVRSDEMRAYLNENSGRVLESLNSQGAGMAKDFLELRNRAGVNTPTERDTLLGFFDELQKIGAEFGYRTASEINRFNVMMKALDDGLSTNEIMDYAILQKLLPKVHGSRRKLEPVLRKLIQLCVSETYQSELDNLISQKTSVEELREQILYPESLTKILRMYRSMTDNGFTSFAEA